MMKNLTNARGNEILGGNEMNKTLMETLSNEIAAAEANGVTRAHLIGAKRVLKNLASGKADQEEYALAVSMLKMQQSGAKIEDAETLLKFSKVLKAKEYISFANITISRSRYDDSLNGSIGINSSPVGRAFQGFATEDTITVPAGVGYISVNKHGFAPFTKGLVSINFLSDNDLQQCSDTGLAMVHAGYKTIACVKNTRTNKWENVCTNKSYTEEELRDYTKENDGDLRIYKCFVYSPSDTRNKAYAAMDVTVEDRREEHLELVSNGGWSKTKEEVEELKKSGASDEEIQMFILKAMPRFGQLKAGSYNLGKIESWSYYNGNFHTAGGDTLDGTGYLRASFVARLFSEILGIEVTPDAVAGLFIQARPDLQKGAYKVMNDYSFNVMLGRLSNDGVGCTPQGSKKDTMDSVMIVDRNVVKMESNYNVNDICLEMLEIAAPSSANLSKQALEKPLAVDADAACDFAFQLGVEHIDRIFNKLVNPKASIPTPGEATKAYVSDLVVDIAPKITYQSPAVMRSRLKNDVQSCVNANDKLKFSIDGVNARLISDYTELFAGVGEENSILKYGEIWLPHAEKHFKKKFRKEAIELAKADGLAKDEAKAFVAQYVSDKLKEARVCMIKYPSMGVKEYYLARPLTLAEIKKRVKALSCSEAIKKAIFLMFKEQTDGVAMLPAIQIVMFQCAGLDYDYDGATFIYDERYTSLLKEQTPEATDID